MASSLSAVRASARSAVASTGRSRSGGEQLHRFTKLKSVLVNNLLREYHKRRTDGSNDEEVYRLAVMEVERILSSGKVTEPALKRLQKKFALAASRGELPSPSHTVVNDAPAASHAAESQVARSEAPPVPPLGLPESEVSQSGDYPKTGTTGHGRSRKQPAPVDEWSVITLFNDVRHFEEQKEKNAAIADRKMRQRQLLSQQISERTEGRKRAKDEEKHFYNSQQQQYEAWREEQMKLEEKRLQQAARDRDAAVRSLEEVRDRKRKEKMKQRENEMRELAVMEAELEKERAEKELDRQRVQEQMLQVIEDNKKDQVRRAELKRLAQEEDVRLAKVQAEMQEKAEAARAAGLEAVYAKQAKLGEMANARREKELEAERELERRIEETNQQRQRREMEEMEEKRANAERLQAETSAMIHQQLDLKRQQRVQEKQDAMKEMERLNLACKQAEADRRAEALAARERKLHFRRTLENQMQENQSYRARENAMSDVERRLNQHTLQKVIEEGQGVLGVQGTKAIQNSLESARSNPQSNRSSLASQRRSGRRIPGQL